MVEWKKLGEVCEIKGRIGFRGYTRKDQVNEGEGALSLSPINITDGKINFSKGTYITWEKYKESPEIMTFDGDIIFCKTASVGKVALVKNLPCKATINPQLVVLKDIQCNTSFLAYVLETDAVQNKVISLAGVGSVPNISQSKLSQILIPLPSISEQTHIVSILDTFTDSIETLKKQLENRKKQYEHYRNRLLDLEGKEGVEWKKLEEISKVERGKRVVRKDLMNEGTIPVYQNSLTPLGFAEKSNYPANTPFIISAGAAGVVGFSKVEYWGADDCFSIICSNQINSKYIYFFLLNKELYLKSQIRGGAIKRLAKDVVNGLLIPVVSQEKQKDIVEKLDLFEASIHNIEQQISLRQKQYEYYRNKLLTFE